MTLPADLHTRTVTATFPAATGSALPSSVTFTPTTTLTDATGAVIIPAYPVVANAPFGTASVTLATTDNATIAQNGYWAYTVQVVNAGVAAAPYDVLVPTGSGSIDLSSLAPVTLGNPVSGSGVTSVNGMTGPAVTLTAAEVGALTAADNLSDLASASTARTNLGLGTAATENVGTAAGTVAAGNDSRLVGASQNANNLSDLTNEATARTNLGLGGAAVDNVGTTAGTVAAGNDSRITGALQAANNLSDLTNTATALTNLGLYGTPYSSDTPAQHGLAEYNFALNTSPVGTILVTQTVYGIMLYAQTNTKISKVGYISSVGATSPVAGENLMGIYSYNGTNWTQLAVTGDLTTWNPANTLNLASLSSQVQLVPETPYAILFLSCASTPVTLRGIQATTLSYADSGDGTAPPWLKFFTVGAAGQTTLPSTFAPSSMSATNALSPFAGLV